MVNVWTYVASNAVTILAVIISAIGWLKRKFDKAVVQPINDLSKGMDSIQSDVVKVHDLATSAHQRLDAHLEGLSKNA